MARGLTEGQKRLRRQVFTPQGSTSTNQIPTGTPINASSTASSSSRSSSANSPLAAMPETPDSSRSSSASSTATSPLPAMPGTPGTASEVAENGIQAFMGEHRSYNERIRRLLEKQTPAQGNAKKGRLPLKLTVSKFAE